MIPKARPTVGCVQTPLLNLSKPFLTPTAATQQNLIQKKKEKEKAFPVVGNCVTVSDVASLWKSELQHWVTSCEVLPTGCFLLMLRMGQENLEHPEHPKNVQILNPFLGFLFKLQLCIWREEKLMQLPNLYFFSPLGGLLDYLNHEEFFALFMHNY